MSDSVRDDPEAMRRVTSAVKTLHLDETETEYVFMLAEYIFARGVMEGLQSANDAAKAVFETTRAIEAAQAGLRG